MAVNDAATSAARSDRVQPHPPRTGMPHTDATGRCIGVEVPGSIVFLTTPASSSYRANRVAQHPNQLSTLAATVQALAMIEGDAFDGGALLGAFWRFVECVAERRAVRAAGRSM